jgi:hypothetical protein
MFLEEFWECHGGTMALLISNATSGCRAVLHLPKQQTTTVGAELMACTCGTGWVHGKQKSIGSFTNLLEVGTCSAVYGPALNCSALQCSAVGHQVTMTMSVTSSAKRQHSFLLVKSTICPASQMLDTGKHLKQHALPRFYETT